jgi:cytochrome c biogenesis protein CcmG/thiol:disulfide interchange protein DsbE
VLALLALLAYGIAQNHTGQSIDSQLAAGKRPAPPALKLPPLGGGTPVSLDSYRGQVVVLNFWASWCAPCRDEAPLLEETARARPDVVFIGLNIQDRQPDALAYLAEYQISYPSGADPTGAISIDYGVSGIPETYFIDPSRRIVKKWFGPLNQAQVQEYLRRIS